MATSERKIALAMMAHPDDAEFVCVGTLIRLADVGWEVHIATMTPGDCGTMIDTRWDISSTRTGEARRAAAMIGAKYHCLDERDGFVFYERQSLQKCIDLFRRVGPSLVFTHPPKDYMMDHEMTSILAKNASFLQGSPNTSAFPLLPGTGLPWLYYCDTFDSIASTRQEAQPTTWIDITGPLAKKIEALACHASQREWLRAHHGNDEYLDSARLMGAHRGKQCGVVAAEAFVQHRGHPYPHRDLLAELFPIQVQA